MHTTKLSLLSDLRPLVVCYNDTCSPDNRNHAEGKIQLTQIYDHPNVLHLQMLIKDCHQSNAEYCIQAEKLIEQDHYTLCLLLNSRWDTMMQQIQSRICSTFREQR
jgi:hypothetical protein